MSPDSGPERRGHPQTHATAKHGRYFGLHFPVGGGMLWQIPFQPGKAGVYDLELLDTEN